MIRIESLDDGRLDEFRHVGDHAWLVAHALFVAEGRLVVRRLIDGRRFATRALLVTETALASLEGLFVQASIPVFVVPQEVMSGVTGFNFHRGCLALGVRPPESDWREVARVGSRLVALERVGNVDNVGAIFRSASAFGVEGVLLQEACADPLYRKAIRTSMGASLALPYAWVRPWPQALKDFGEAGWLTIGLTPSPEAAPIAEVANQVRGRRAMVVVGHEGEGLAMETLRSCAYLARIPMAAGVDSLNVATATAIACYEMWGQSPG